MNDDNRDETDRPSRTRLKREAQDLQAAGERLLALPETKLARLPLPEALRDAVRLGRQLAQRSALRRQRQYIGRLMRELDTAELLDALAHLDQQDAQETREFHAAETWRERLLTEGSAALEAFFDAHPHADRQRLRQLVTASMAERKAGNAPRHQRELFREIRHVIERAP